MINILRFIFGGGWWTLWYFLMYLLVFLPHPFYFRELFDWTWHKKGEPAGALAVWMAGVAFFGLPLAFFSVVNGLLFAGLARGSGLTRTLLVLSLLIVVGVAYIVLMMMVAARNFPALITSYLVILGVVGFNLWMLWMVRQRHADTPHAEVRGGWLTVASSIVPLLIIGLIGLVVAINVFDKWHDARLAKQNVGGMSRADDFVREYVRGHWHNTPKGLDPGGAWVGLYGCRIEYDAARDLLVAKADLSGVVKPELFEKVAASIDDPDLGGRYDHRGATFHVDHGARTIIMQREFPVKGVRAKEFSAAMADFWDASRYWNDGFLQRLQAIAQGTMPPPERAMTLEEDRAERGIGKPE